MGREWEESQKLRPVLAESRREFRKQRPTWAGLGRDLPEERQIRVYVGGEKGVFRTNALCGQGKGGAAVSTSYASGARH